MYNSDYDLFTVYLNIPYIMCIVECIGRAWMRIEKKKSFKDKSNQGTCIMHINFTSLWLWDGKMTNSYAGTKYSNKNKQEYLSVRYKEK